MYGYQYVCQYYCTLIFNLIKPLHSSIISFDSKAFLCYCKNDMMIKEIIVFSMYFNRQTPYFLKGVLNAINIFIIC